MLKPVHLNQAACEPAVRALDAKKGTRRMEWIIAWLEEHGLSLTVAGASGAIMAGFRVGRYFGDITRQLASLERKIDRLEEEVEEGKEARGRIYRNLSRAVADIAWVRGRCARGICLGDPAIDDDEQDRDS